MSVSTEVQRTLVKSPPELWSELSNPDALARHLVELGEIRITSTEPETKVEWEADGVMGAVHLKQSGWGTKVTLSVTRVPPTLKPEPVTKDESEPTAVVEPVAEDKPQSAAEPAPIAEAEPHPVPVEPDPVETQPITETTPELGAEPRPRFGFFARLFRRRAPKHSEGAEIESQPPTIEPEPDFEPLAAPELIYEPTPKPVADLAAELASVEAQMELETTELLTGVLDRLGAAHHRPFSRG